MVNVYLSGTVSNTSVSGSVGPASASTIVSANAKRMSLVLINDGANTAYISLGASAVSGNGIRLNPAGASYEINGSNLYTGYVSAITTSGTTRFTIMEMSTE